MKADEGNEGRRREVKRNERRGKQMKANESSESR